MKKLLLLSLLSVPCMGIAMDSAKEYVGELTGNFFLTDHALERMKNRNIKIQEIASVLKHGKKYLAKKERYKPRCCLCVENGLTVVIEPAQKNIITAYRTI